MTIPTENDLVAALRDATKKAVIDLFTKHPEQYYYLSLITTGEALPPYLTAWSKEALERALEKVENAESERLDLKWCHVSSPYSIYGEEYFGHVKQLFAQRPTMDFEDDESWEKEGNFRIRAMEMALAQLDNEGLFGKGEERLKIVINVEYMPPDFTNIERARRLNPAAALTDWLREAAEE